MALVRMPTYYRNFIGFLFLVLCPVHVVLSAKGNCTAIDGKPSCVCSTTKGIIDLTPLSKTDGTPMFPNISDPHNNYYSYNPCKAFTNGKCIDAYMCQFLNNEQYNFADDSTEKIVGNDDGSFSAAYASQNPLVNSVTVKLHCDQGVGFARMVGKGDDNEPFNFVFELYSCQVCPGGCKESSAQITGIVGLVVIILFILGIITYFIAGAIVMKVRYQASGSDIIPNKSFWFELPGLVKDGCLFITSPCRNFIRERHGYSKM